MRRARASTSGCGGSARDPGRAGRRPIGDRSSRPAYPFALTETALLKRSAPCPPRARLRLRLKVPAGERATPRSKARGRGRSPPRAQPATAASVPASRKNASHLVPLREVRCVQRRQCRHVREVADDDEERVADGAVVRVQLGERSSEPLLRVADLHPRAGIRWWKALPPVRYAGGEELVFTWEVAVDREPLDACLIGDPADGRPCRPDGHVESDGGLDDPLLRLCSRLRAPRLSISPLH